MRHWAQPAHWLIMNLTSSDPCPENTKTHLSKITWRISETTAQHSPLTYERNGLREKLREVLAPVIGDGNLFVLEVPFVFKHVGQVGRHVQDVLDIVLAEHIQVGGVFGTAQVKVGQDLDRERWLVVGERTALRLCGAARLAVRFPIWAVGADAEPSETEDGGWWGAAGTGAVQIDLAVLWVLWLELVEASWSMMKTKEKQAKTKHVSIKPRKQFHWEERRGV